MREELLNTYLAIFIHGCKGRVSSQHLHQYNTKRPHVYGLGVGQAQNNLRGPECGTKAEHEEPRPTSYTYFMLQETQDWCYLHVVEWLDITARLHVVGWKRHAEVNKPDLEGLVLRVHQHNIVCF